MKYKPQLQAMSPWVAARGVTPQTHLSTPQGERLASDLAVGDLLMTRDDGPQPITEIRLSLAAPNERKHFPVCIRKDSLGFGKPRVDLRVGAQHRVLYDDINVPLTFGADAVLVRAKSFAVSTPRIAVENPQFPVSYIQITLAKQSIIFAEGVPIETIQPDDSECELAYVTLRSWELMSASAVALAA